jgi:hypothetical protein
MGTTMPDTVAYQSDTSVRVMLHSALVLSGTSNTSDFTHNYAKLPPSSNPWLQVPAGVLNRNFYDPNYYPSASGIPQGVDPSTVNGVAWAAPYTNFGIGKPLSVVIRGITFVYLKGGGTIAAGDLLFCGDQYGRVDNAANLSITTGSVWVLGRAQQAAAATANLLIAIDVNIQVLDLSGATGPTGATGATGPTGPTGP